jgi:hypothetical protein
MIEHHTPELQQDKDILVIYIMLVFSHSRQLPALARNETHG